MNKIALFIFLFAVAFACEPTVEEKQAMLENKFNDYIDIDIYKYKIDICQFKTLENAVERQISWELEKLLHSGKVKSKISLK